MSIFDKLRKDLKEDTRLPEPTGWENMSQLTPTEDLEKIRASEKRQYNKLVGALLPGNGNPDLSKITAEPNLGPHDENIVLAKISQGIIGYNDFSKVIDNIKGPLADSSSNFNFMAGTSALEKMHQDKHELKILSYANSNNASDYENLSVDDIQRTVSTLKNPMQFEAKMRPFMTFLAEHNSPEKVREYESALDSLEHSLYGKKYDYYKRSKELVKKSQEIFGMPVVSPLELFSAPEAKPEPAPARNVEQEQNHEQLIIGGSEYQMSRTQVTNGQFARMGEIVPYDESCEDSKYVDLEHGLIGVFDGAGGHGGGKEASQIAVQTMAELMNVNGEPKNSNDLSDWLDEAGRRVANNPVAGYSTATVAKITARPNGSKAVMYAQVGDSRLYIVHPDGRAEQVTKDEGEGRTITNALGANGQGITCVQAGFRELHAGDKLVLCSDGITGDKGTDLMYEDELGQIVKNAGDTAYAAQALVNNARKRDDRTAIVVEV